ncbi:MAG: Tetratricopeptide 4 [Deltaproteobacteria bacterium]|nr:Tetratricopeptide 4 [Deltaproteobacteria bacterium]
MAKKRRGAPDGEGLERLFGLLDEAPPGLHDIEPAASALPSGLPPELIELYSHCDGLRLFIDATEVVRATEVTMATPGRWRFAETDGDAISIDQRGRIWRLDPSLDDDICEGTRLDRWLGGVLDATAMLYDGDGEFADAVFDEDGEVLPEVRERQLRCQLKRDPAAPGPRWRLAQALLEQGAQDDARNELEQVVADDPAFAWAWLDLARISEKAGELANAVDETRMAAETAEAAQHSQAGYFWAQLARLGARTGDEILRAQAATKTSLVAPELKEAQLAGVRESLEAGDAASAKGLLELLRAVWPRDLQVLELANRLEQGEN